jgi:hypothetical protein
MGNEKILNQAAPVQVTRIMRLIIGTAFHQGERRRGKGAGKGARQQYHAGQDGRDQLKSPMLHNLLYRSGSIILKIVQSKMEDE